jgi:cytochrome P450
MATTAEITAPMIFDPLDPANIQEPFELFKRMRTEQPVYWNEKYVNWMLTRYKDVKAALQSPQKFSSQTGTALLPWRDKLPESAQAHFDTGYRFFYTQFQATDPPVHTVQRQAVMKAFMPLVNGMIKSSIERRVNELLDRMERAGTCDFMADFAYPLPSNVIFDLLGIPEEDHQLIREASEQFVRFPVGALQSDCEILEQSAEKLTQAEAVILKLVQARRRQPKTDLISALVSADSGVDQLPDKDIAIISIFMLVAGNETTANLLGGAMRFLLSDRRQWQMLLGRPELLPGAVEELLRFVSPVLWLSRVANEDMEINGHLLTAGSRIILGIGASNHDPDQFENPEALDVTRKNVNALAFGHGIHTCLGAALARMETQSALAALLRRLPRIELRTNEFEYRPIYFLRSLKSLPVSVNG